MSARKNEPEGVTSIFKERLRILLNNENEKSPLKRKVTQEELAQVLYCKRQVIGRYIKGDATPDLERLKIIADFFKVPYNYLLGNSEAIQEENINISVKTGLSDEAIRTLIALKGLSGDMLNKAGPEYILKYTKRRDRRYALDIINFLLDPENLEWFVNPILNYVDKVRGLQKRIEWIHRFKALIEKQGDEIIYLKEPLPDGITIDEETLKEKSIPKNEILQEFETQDLKEQVDYAEWQIAKYHSKFALTIANSIIEKFDELPEEDM